MKNTLILLTTIVLLGLTSACKKCYRCHNLCKACYEKHLSSGGDTTLTIIVRSDLLGEKYYQEYIDSLTSPSLGWTCNDTASNYNERFCESQAAAELLSRKDGGLICNAE